MRYLIVMRDSLRGLGTHSGEYANEAEAKCDALQHLVDGQELVDIRDITGHQTYHIHSPSAETGDGCHMIEAANEAEAVALSQRVLAADGLSAPSLVQDVADEFDQLQHRMQGAEIFNSVLVAEYEAYRAENPVQAPNVLRLNKVIEV